MITIEQSLLRLMHLASPGLPVGAYAFSQGLETAMDMGWLKTPAQTEDWLRLQLRHGLGYLDIPVFIRLYRALLVQDASRVAEWNNYVLASRETRELQLADKATGLALHRLLPALGITPLMAEAVAEGEAISFVCSFAQAAVSWHIDERLAAIAYCWSWLENQVNAATKLLPLGQTQAQQLLHAIQQEIPDVVASALLLDDEHIGMSLSALTLASMYHETQYTRLFRS